MIPQYQRRREDDVTELPTLNYCEKWRTAIIQKRLVGLRELSFFYKLAKYDKGEEESATSSDDESNALFRLDQ